MPIAEDITRETSVRRRLTRSTLTGSPVIRKDRPIVYCPAAPKDLLREAQVVDASCTLDEYALARMLASEGYGGGSEGRSVAYVLMACAAINQAKTKGVSPSGLLLRSVYGIPLSGHFGEQNGRYASTKVDPYTDHLLAARTAVENLSLGQGVDQYFSPVLQDQGSQGGRRLDSDADAILLQWTAGQRAPIGPFATIDPYELMFFGPEYDASKRASQIAWGKDVIRRGRAGIRIPGGGSFGSVLLVALLGKLLLGGLA